jgi:hypothetical protein
VIVHANGESHLDVALSNHVLVQSGHDFLRRWHASTHIGRTIGRCGRFIGRSDGLGSTRRCIVRSGAGGRLRRLSMKLLILVLLLSIGGGRGRGRSGRYQHAVMEPLLLLLLLQNHGRLGRGEPGRTGGTIIRILFEITVTKGHVGAALSQTQSTIGPIQPYVRYNAASLLRSRSAAPMMHLLWDIGDARWFLLPLRRLPCPALLVPTTTPRAAAADEAKIVPRPRDVYHGRHRHCRSTKPPPRQNNDTSVFDRSPSSRRRENDAAVARVRGEPYGSFLAGCL